MGKTTEPDKINDLKMKIQALRQQLHILIDSKTDLQNEEVIKASEDLDALLYEYEKIINRKES